MIIEDDYLPIVIRIGVVELLIVQTIYITEMLISTTYARPTYSIPIGITILNMTLVIAGTN